jgi:hypothetical protein
MPRNLHQRGKRAAWLAERFVQRTSADRCLELPLPCGAAAHVVGRDRTAVAHGKRIRHRGRRGLGQRVNPVGAFRRVVDQRAGVNRERECDFGVAVVACRPRARGA